MKGNKNIQIFIIFILVLGFMGTSLMSYLVSRTSVRNQIATKQLPLTSDNVYSEVQNDILKPIFISSLMASDTFLRDWIITGEQNPIKIEKYLKEIKYKYGVFSSFLVSDSTLSYYYGDGILKKVKENEIRDSWYFRVRNMKGDYEINVDPDMANHDNLTIFINYKVFDYKGKYLGATGVGLKVDKVNSIIGEYQKKYKSKIHFIDKNGEVRLSNNLQIGSQYRKDIVEYIESKEQNSKPYSYEQNGENIMVNIRYIPEFKWYLVVEQSDKDDTDILSKTLMLNSIITFLVISIVILIISNKWRKYQKELRNLALTDKLTGILNRQAFEIDSINLIENSLKREKRFSLMMFDIDNFKNVNDTYGHHKGDLVIKEVVSITKNRLNGNHKIYRWGGDEFIVLLENEGVDKSYIISELLRKDIEGNNFLKESEITVSVGLVEYQDEKDIDILLKKADKLMYISKSKGKNRVEKINIL